MQQQRDTRMWLLAPDAAAEVLYDHASDYDLEMLKKSQEYLAEKFMEDTDTWGMMKDEVWDNYSAFLQEYGVIFRGTSGS